MDTERVVIPKEPSLRQTTTKTLNGQSRQILSSASLTSRQQLILEISFDVYECALMRPFLRRSADCSLVGLGNPFALFTKACL